MSYGEFDAKKYKEEIDIKLDAISRLSDIANEKKCYISIDGMSAQPRDTQFHADSTQEAVSMLKFISKLRKAFGAFLDNIPE